MTTNTLSAPLYGDTEVATPLEIVAPRALYEAGFSTRPPKTRNQSFSRPSGWRLPCGGRRLTKTEEEESIIINRFARSIHGRPFIAKGLLAFQDDRIEIAAIHPASICGTK